MIKPVKVFITKSKGHTAMHGDATTRNTGINFDAGWINQARVNGAALERRVNSLPGRRSVKKAHQAAWQLRAISCIDLTTLAGDDTENRVRRLAAKARNPLSRELVDALGINDMGLTTAALCCYHDMIPAAYHALAGSGVPIAAVSTGFPGGLSPFDLRIAEIGRSVDAGAAEIDIVISRRLVLEGRWFDLYNEIKEMRAACRHATMKAILATGEIGRPANILKASLVAMMAGADFIKTSTGKEGVNATLPTSLIMLRAIRDYYAATGFQVGYKPAGGISKAKDAVNYLILVNEELGRDWVSNRLFRFGASSLLGDLERQLDHYAFGAYSAGYRHAVA